MFLPQNFPQFLTICNTKSSKRVTLLVSARSPQKPLRSLFLATSQFSGGSACFRAPLSLLHPSYYPCNTLSRLTHSGRGSFGSLLKLLTGIQYALILVNNFRTQKFSSIFCFFNPQGFGILCNI